MPGPGRRAERLLRRPPAVLLGAGLVLFAVLCGLALLVQGVRAGLELRRTDRALTDLRAAASTPAGLPRLPGLLARLQTSAAAAQDRTDSPLWSAAAHLPLVGDTFRTARGTTVQVDRLAADVLPGVVDGATALPDLRDERGRVDLARLSGSAPALARAADGARAAQVAVDALPGTLLPPLDRGRERLARELRALTGQVEGLRVAATAGPGLLGADGPRRYLLVVQNNAEARASGGIVGAYGVLRADRGQVSLESIGSDSDLVPAQRPVVDLGPEFARRYDRLGTTVDWREATATPDFPSAAQVLLGLARATRGESLDGVVSVDPVALADVLAAVGPQRTSDGRTVTAATAVPLLLQDAYARYPDKAQRSAVLTSTARAAFTAVAGGAGDPAVLAERLGHAVATGHLKVFSRVPAEQAALATTDLAGALPTDASPYLQVVTQDAGASKLSYYLRRDVAYDGVLADRLLDLGDGRGPQPVEEATVRVTLTNTAPAQGLPAYVTLREDLPGGRAPVPGRSNTLVSVYLGRGGQLLGATLGGEPVAVQSETEQGLAVLTTSLQLDPGASRVLELRVRQPAAPGSRLTYVQQPLVVDDTVSVTRRDALDPAARAEGALR